MEKIRQELESIADEKYRAFSSKLNPEVSNILGVRLPVLRNIAKRLAADDSTDYVALGGAIYMEEIMLQGMIVGYLKLPWSEKAPLVAAFVPKISNWAVCDTFCTGLKFKESERAGVWAFLQPYLKSGEAYEIRFAVVMLLEYFVNDEYAERAFATFDLIRHDDYYVKMAVAWAVSIYFRDLPETSMIYLKNNRMDDWTHNKALQKITESLAVAPEAKDVVRLMKRKLEKKPTSRTGSAR